MDIALWFLATVATLVYGVATAGEIAFPAAGRNGMRAQNNTQRQDLESQNAGQTTGINASVEDLTEDPARFLITMGVLKTLALIGLGLAVARLLSENAGFWQMLGVAFVVGVVVVLGNAVARRWILAHPGSVAVRVAPVLLVVMYILTPITFLARAVSNRHPGDEEEGLRDDVLLSENGLRLLMGIGGDDNPILESEKEMIASILEMDDTAAREVMVPRMDMIALNVETPLADALDVIMEVGHSRIPIYEENIDRIVGILYAKDLLRCYRENRYDDSIRELMRTAHFVPLSKKVNVLLRDMQKHRVHIAMVVDEYGGTAGLVTIEDILEEIVGDIQDEYDKEEEQHVEIVEPDVYLLNSRLDLYSISKLLDVELSDEDADTLGGLIYSLLGHVPAQGEALDVEGWRFTVVAVDGNRIDQVRANRVPTDPVSTDPVVADALANEAKKPIEKASEKASEKPDRTTTGNASTVVAVSERSASSNGTDSNRTYSSGANSGSADSKRGDSGKNGNYSLGVSESNATESKVAESKVTDAKLRNRA